MGRIFELSSVSCVPQKTAMSADYCLLWHMEKFIHFQEKFVTGEDIRRYFSGMVQTEFDNYEQFEQIQLSFVSIIKHQVMAKGGIFYYGDDTLQSPSS